MDTHSPEGVTSALSVSWLEIQYLTGRGESQKASGAVNKIERITRNRRVRCEPKTADERQTNDPIMESSSGRSDGRSAHATFL
ncbi:hypothetical protein EVAR_5247_1 [Eumeta japonica]|uniref:Uncharacterized protein n=1 Tax=Eumeta variegata TaxID=151549 RepID=A0A4C1XMS2_EUMVA|nr:hypothetical protein EVAR_5247_1 [Eumeta japonica]